MNLTFEQAALLLARLPKIGPRTAKKLIDHFKDSREIFSARPDKLLKINGLGESHLKSIRHWEAIFPQVVKEEEEIKKQALSLNTYGSNAYPLPLSFTADPPTVFFQKGEVNWQNKRVISIVGTREPTSRGLALCRTLVEQLAPYRPLIVSGFARGIDIEAHKTALRCGLETVAVLGHAFGRWYPREHQNEVKPILSNGAFISEFWSDAPFERQNFLKRNRIISGLAHASIIIESGARGGSLATAHHAIAYGREVFAFPGRVGDPKSVGCLNLIKKDKARLITSVEDVVEWLEWTKEEETKAVQKQLFVSLTAEEKEIYAAVEEEISLDELALRLGWTIPKTATQLTQIELKGLIRSLGGKRYERV